MAAVFAPQYKTVAYDATSTEGVAVITLDRPEVANAQDLRMTYDLNECFDEACADPGVRCIVLRANGKHFSSGHDLAGDGLVVGRAPAQSLLTDLSIPVAPGALSKPTARAWSKCTQGRGKYTSKHRAHLPLVSFRSST